MQVRSSHSYDTSGIFVVAVLHFAHCERSKSGQEHHYVNTHRDFLCDRQSKAFHLKAFEWSESVMAENNQLGSSQMNCLPDGKSIWQVVEGWKDMWHSWEGCTTLTIFLIFSHLPCRVTTIKWEAAFDPLGHSTLGKIRIWNRDNLQTTTIPYTSGVEF